MLLIAKFPKEHRTFGHKENFIPIVNKFYNEDITIEYTRGCGRIYTLKDLENKSFWATFKYTQNDIDLLVLYSDNYDFIMYIQSELNKLTPKVLCNLII